MRMRTPGSRFAAYAAQCGCTGVLLLMMLFLPNCMGADAVRTHENKKEINHEEINENMEAQTKKDYR
jgi:hypothetical protein